MLRIIDANINRIGEGLRVCEDIIRFILNNRKLTLSLKKLRHDFHRILKENPLFSKENLLKYRDTKFDVGKNLILNRKKRDVFELFLANIQRVEEGLRVLEEICKLFESSTENDFRNLRFRVYDLEKRALKLVFRYAKEKNI